MEHCQKENAGRQRSVIPRGKRLNQPRQGHAGRELSQQLVEEGHSSKAGEMEDGMSDCDVTECVSVRVFDLTASCDPEREILFVSSSTHQ